MNCFRNCVSYAVGTVYTLSLYVWTMRSLLFVLKRYNAHINCTWNMFESMNTFHKRKRYGFCHDINFKFKNKLLLFALLYFLWAFGRNDSRFISSQVISAYLCGLLFLLHLYVPFSVLTVHLLVDFWLLCGFFFHVNESFNTWPKRTHPFSQLVYISAIVCYYNPGKAFTALLSKEISSFG